jgi:hypothetical protein
MKLMMPVRMTRKKDREEKQKWDGIFSKGKDLNTATIELID